jgi:hypothetical protein
MKSAHQQLLTSWSLHLCRKLLMGTCVSLIGFAFSFSDRAHPGAVGITAPFIHSSLNGAMLSGGLQHGSQRREILQGI